MTNIVSRVPNSGAFGQNGRKGGRPKGVRNKLGGEVRTLLADHTADTFPKFREMLAKIDDPVKYCTIWTQAAEYAIPKLARTEHVGDGGGPVVIRASREDEAI